MSSTVTVFETTARRTVIKVTPAKYLHEICAEACAKFKLSPDKYGLKHNNKALDLSTPFRHTGLAAGARLELTLLSRSAGVVNIALQLPEAEASGAVNGRLVDKFPSTTTLWQILRKFEDGVAGSNTKRNLTARGAPRTSTGGTGAGRLYYEQPVLVVMHKELSTFVDLQKSLSSLGLNSGNVLIKLTFKPSEQPFEDAQEQIGQYFQELEGGERELQDSQKEEQATETISAEQRSPEMQESEPAAAISNASMVETQSPDTAVEGNVTGPDDSVLQSESGNVPGPIQGVTERPTTIFSAPSSSTPKAATISHNEADFEYTVEHAHIQNAQYKTAGRNKTLPSDAQVEAKRKEAAERLASVQSLKIRTRFPDNTQSLAEFNQQDTGQDLYAHVRKLLRHENAPFTLRHRGTRGMADLPDSKHRLIQDIGMTGDATVFLNWKDNASVAARQEPALKSQVAANAKEIEVPVIESRTEQNAAKEAQTGQKVEKTEKKPGGMPAWLKKTLPGGKR